MLRRFPWKRDWRKVEDRVRSGVSGRSEQGRPDGRCTVISDPCKTGSRRSAISWQFRSGAHSSVTAASSTTRRRKLCSGGAGRPRRGWFASSTIKGAGEATSASGYCLALGLQLDAEREQAERFDETLKARSAANPRSLQ